MNWSSRTRRVDDCRGAGKKHCRRLFASRSIAVRSFTGLAIPLGWAIALFWANQRSESYFRMAHDLAFVVNDVGTALFFAMLTQEVLKATMPGGALHTWRRAALPIVAALGGAIGAVGVYAAFLLAGFRLDSGRAVSPVIAAGPESIQRAEPRASQLIVAHRARALDSGIGDPVPLCLRRRRRCRPRCRTRRMGGDGRCGDRAAGRHAGGGRRGSGARPAIAAQRRLTRADRHRAGGVLCLYVRPVFCQGDVRDPTGADGIKSGRTLDHRWRADRRGCGLDAGRSTSSVN
jgi:hypothetical protein